MNAVPAGPEAGHRRRHRPVHPVHRLHRRRDHRQDQGTSAETPVRRSSTRRRRPPSCSDRPVPHDRPVRARKIPGALLLSILITTIIAILVGVTADPDARSSSTPDFSTLGQFDVTDVFRTSAPSTAVLTIFAIMLTDFFDTMGTVTADQRAGRPHRRGRSRAARRSHPAGRLRRPRPLGGVAGISSNTSYIESAAGVAEGGRTGFTSVVTGPALPGRHPADAAGRRSSRTSRPAPVLVLVGFLMFELIKDIDVTDLEEGFPALLDDDPDAPDLQTSPSASAPAFVA